tara:strand:+ start:16 stop:510 length:495 start_codon:yes stop_codon:yes gene_type:complete
MFLLLCLVFDIKDQPLTLEEKAKKVRSINLKMNSKQDLKEILSNVKNIALVGASPKLDRDSYMVMEALMHFGYKIFPVNPIYSDNEILGQKCYPNLKAIKQKVDMVDVFRAKNFIFDLTKEAIEIKADVLWMQEGLIDEEAANLARNKSMIVVMDECPKKVLEA